MILDITLIANAKTLLRESDFIINKDYKPPWQLQLNSRSRKEFSKWYYEDNTFRVDYWQLKTRTDILLGLWLRSLSTTSRARLLNIHLSLNLGSALSVERIRERSGGRPEWFIGPLTAHRERIAFVRLLLERDNIQLKRGTLKECCFVLGEGVAISKAWLSEEDMEKKIQE